MWEPPLCRSIPQQLPHCLLFSDERVRMAHCSCVWHPLQEKDNGWPKVLDIYFENNDTVAFSWEEAITIEETGMYYLWFVICDDELSAATVRGQTTWKNPTGDPQGYPPALIKLALCVQGILNFPVHFQQPRTTVEAKQPGLAAPYLALCGPSKKHPLCDKQHGHGHANCRMGRMLFLRSVSAFLIVPEMLSWHAKYEDRAAKSSPLYCTRHARYLLGMRLQHIWVVAAVSLCRPSSFEMSS